MLRARLATAGVVIPLLIVVILYAPPWLFAAVVGGIAAFGVVEYFAMAFPAQLGNRVFGIAMGWMFVGAMASASPEWVAMAMVIALVVGLSWTLLARPDFEKGLADLGFTFLGAAYVGVLLPYFIWLWREPQGPYWVIFLLAVAMAGDSSGYFVGRAAGRHKLMPRVSPGKTVEGALGILAGNALGGGMAKLVVLPELSWAEALVIAVAAGVLGQVGDLCESMMKRTFTTKESGWLFPGHGGVLDRIDSLVFPVALLYYYVNLYR
ncbi:MAG: phosphatidate cytidylyltransferase [Deltaproteobacteria bacterium]|nr:phosphatidate cytidylyltransferase [Deltaproteobacteria bacterium]